MKFHLRPQEKYGFQRADFHQNHDHSEIYPNCTKNLENGERFKFILWVKYEFTALIFTEHKLFDGITWRFTTNFT